MNMTSEKSSILNHFKMVVLKKKSMNTWKQENRKNILIKLQIIYTQLYYNIINFLNTLSYGLINLQKIIQG